MDSSGFSSLVKNFTSLTEEEAANLGKLSDQYPYSQLIHLIQSRAAKDLRNPKEADFLHQSAVYSTDRTVLKWVMTAPRLERTIARPTIPEAPKPAEVLPVLPDPPVKIKVEVVPEAKVSPSPVSVKNDIKPSLPVERVSLSGDALRDDLIYELEKLQKLKHDFEVSVEAFEKKSFDGETKKKLKTDKDPVADPLIEEIKTTRKKLKTESSKQKEQNEIIEEFIKTQPALPKPKSNVPAEDLAEDSGMFSDNIVSETLVNILIKQGKKDKAIEVLKKLIWKFPQKKTYFAAKIEDLKN